MMAQHTFRADLYYRLNVYTIQLPPLRERAGDLPLLVNYFLCRINLELDKQVWLVDSDAMDCLNEYSWPGNLRELQGVLKHAVLEATGPVILCEFLPEIVRATARNSHSVPTNHVTQEVPGNDRLLTFIQQRIREGSENLHKEVIQNTERTLLLALLKILNGNFSRAATVLGMARSTLRTKLVALGIAVDRAVHVID